MQSPCLRTVYIRQRKWPLSAPVRKIMALRRKIRVLGCQVFHYSVKCSKYGLRGFVYAVQRRLVTKMVTISTSCWQALSEVELRRIFDVCKRWANSSFACICKEKYGSIHETTWVIRLLIVWKSSTYPQPRPGGLGRGFVLHFRSCSARTARFGGLYRNILFHDWFFVIFIEKYRAHGRKVFLFYFFQRKNGLAIKVRIYRPSSDECERDSWIFLDNFSTSFWWNSVIKIVKWFKLINSSNHLTIFLVEFREN